MKTFKILLVVLTALLTASFALAQTWTQTSAPVTNWISIASSADGSKLVAAANGGFYFNGTNEITLPGPIYTSTNSGATWSQAVNAPDGVWIAVASSADGTKLMAAVGRNNDAGNQGGGIYTSADAGNTWTQFSVLTNNWVSVASSADGTELAAVAQGYPPFYTSPDSGTTWITNASPYDRWTSIASSADGKKLAACGGLGTILTSTNSGISWASTNSFGHDSFLGSIASSADGNRLVMGGGQTIYISINSGLTWNVPRMPTGPWRAVASSADGSKLVAAAMAAPIYVSSDSGTTWTSNGSPSTNWTAVASSADGNKLVAVVNGGGIYTSQSMPLPLINITPTNANLALSWIIPSTNFVLQQNLDLTTTNWTDVTNPPTLNFTNLQNEVTLSMTAGNGFYRLKTL
jgi:photosystem II stability/assembly factor-like uncharacterized protein